MKNKIIEAVESEYMAKVVPSFRSGDTVRVNFRIVEGNKERVQPYEGVVIKIHRGGVGSTFTVRKVVGDVGVERTFPLYSPRIDSIELKRSGRVRRAKLFYLRALRGKATRIRERKKGF
ncbi:50S ribosomal protein L19 [Mucispirillum schaedleri]|jgi:large subunit ribosomal protein L19|uniref:Large ribosomal subunit protein bL19 n=1 Tax=Mucispirillum schaedleri ASF457 TaxID=1379858 RepID=V2Q7X9_9BACT|nr:50S ribosomal protein L19 [Mucispirillum schaedleri]MCX4360999.1 50S ribosomal protein L19 [Mucispirillum schaedleri]USF24858.1 50S ribosomal protein L19 [Mucispirillum schaedleri ASF457]SIW07646.1 50S ribosomal subunit protein L19 [Mucispirillum schaedleri ASF457]